MTLYSHPALEWENVMFLKQVKIEVETQESQVKHQAGNKRLTIITLQVITDLFRLVCLTL